MWKGFELAYDCIPEKAAILATDIWYADAARDFRINAVTYSILEALQWSPLEQKWRDWFQQQFGLTFVLQVPPENSYFTLNVTLWTLIYDQMDAGHFPSMDLCWYLKFPASQGGQWPSRWP